MSVVHQHLLEARLDVYVERICGLGCAAVYRVIAEMEREVTPRAIGDLPALAVEDRQRVLAELKSIMAVYDAREDGPSCKAKFVHEADYSSGLPRIWGGIKSMS
ncbi:MAG: hypothetical protein ACFCUJ_00055 [Thiotrichales bacterium]